MFDAATTPSLQSITFKLSKNNESAESSVTYMYLYLLLFIHLLNLQISHLGNFVCTKFPDIKNTCTIFARYSTVNMTPTTYV